MTGNTCIFAHAHDPGGRLHMHFSGEHIFSQDFMDPELCYTSTCERLRRRVALMAQSELMSLPRGIVECLVVCAACEHLTASIRGV